MKKMQTKHTLIIVGVAALLIILVVTMKQMYENSGTAWQTETNSYTSLNSDDTLEESGDQSFDQVSADDASNDSDLSIQ